jgi:hypothetical protein
LTVDTRVRNPVERREAAPHQVQKQDYVAEASPPAS